MPIPIPIYWYWCRPANNYGSQESPCLVADDSHPRKKPAIWLDRDAGMQRLIPNQILVNIALALAHCLGWEPYGTSEPFRTLEHYTELLGT